MQGLEASSPVAQNVVAQTSPLGIDPEGEVEGEVQLFLPGKVGGSSWRKHTVRRSSIKGLKPSGS